MNQIQKTAAAAIAAHEVAFAAYVKASDAIPEPEDSDDIQAWNAWGAKCEEVRASFEIDRLNAERNAAEAALLEWMVRVMKAEQPRAFTPELEAAAAKAARFPKLRKQLVEKALRLEARS